MPQVGDKIINVNYIDYEKMVQAIDLAQSLNKNSLHPTRRDDYHQIVELIELVATLYNDPKPQYEAYIYVDEGAKGVYNEWRFHSNGITIDAVQRSIDFRCNWAKAPDGIWYGVLDTILFKIVEIAK